MELTRSKKSRLSIDLAPLIDVVFQLLVFFMLTSTFANPSIKMTLPKAMTQETVNPQIIVISIDQQGTLYLNDRLTNIEALKSDLSDKILVSEKKSVHIKGDQDMPYKYFIQIMDIAKQAGAEQINVVHQKNQ